MDSRDPLRARRGRARTTTTAITDALTGVRRRLLRRRRLIAVLLVAVAAAATLHTLAPPPPPSTTLLVAARDLPAGRLLRAGDLVAIEMAPGVVPTGVVSEPAGRLLAAPLRAGEAVTDVRLVGDDLAQALAPGHTAIPVRLSDAGQAALLSVGDRIDLLGTDTSSVTTQKLASVTVLAVPDTSVAADGALPGRLVVVDLAWTEVDRVTAASVAAYVTYAWQPG